MKNPKRCHLCKTFVDVTPSIIRTSSNLGLRWVCPNCEHGNVLEEPAPKAEFTKPAFTKPIFTQKNPSASTVRSEVCRACGGKGFVFNPIYPGGAPHMGAAGRIRCTACNGTGKRPRML